MSGWRGVYAIVLVVFVYAPLLLPFREIATPGTWQWTKDDVARLSQLGINTLELTAGTLAISLPIGLLLAVLLFRTSFVGRRLFVALLAAALFVPLPIIVSSWQGTFGASGWLPLTFLHTEDRPWATGMFAAILIHALAAIPWVAFIVGVGLHWVEPELEDEAAQSTGAWGVLLFATLPRIRASVLAAALFVVLQTAAEISVTDMMLVNTLAEEVFTQFANRDGLARTLALAMPALLIVWGGVMWMVAHLEKTLPPLAPTSRGHRALDLGPWWARLAVGVILLTMLVAPLGSVVWKLGLTGHPSHWSADMAARCLTSESQLLGKDLLATLMVSLVTGVLTAGSALTACWLARDARWFRWLLFSAAVGAWIIPGPVVGIGLQQIIINLPPGPWKDALYYGPSPLPLMWVQAIRALPIAVIFLWPIVRLVPREMTEEARLAGAGMLGQWVGIALPMTWRALVVVALVCSALCLSEVAASTRVETPGWESFTKLLFDRMHYGVDNNVSALCVLMLGSLAGLGLIGVLIGLAIRALHNPSR
jgi:iron(III) transport system permease protein